MPWLCREYPYTFVALYVTGFISVPTLPRQFLLNGEDYPKVWVSKLHLHDVKFGALNAMALDTRTPRVCSR
ncbi:145_t:CDS:2 [Gigaspora rosea]|nr:145_t:CDS:2 [Gigaspora rosea]